MHGAEIWKMKNFDELRCSLGLDYHFVALPGVVRCALASAFIMYGAKYYSSRRRLVKSGGPNKKGPHAFSMSVFLVRKLASEIGAAWVLNDFYVGFENNCDLLRRRRFTSEPGHVHSYDCGAKHVWCGHLDFWFVSYFACCDFFPGPAGGRSLRVRVCFYNTWCVVFLFGGAFFESGGSECKFPVDFLGLKYGSDVGAAWYRIGLSCRF